MGWVSTPANDHSTKQLVKQTNRPLKWFPIKLFISVEGHLFHQLLSGNVAAACLLSLIYRCLHKQLSVWCHPVCPGFTYGLLLFTFIWRLLQRAEEHLRVPRVHLIATQYVLFIFEPIKKTAPFRKDSKMHSQFCSAPVSRFNVSAAKLVLFATGDQRDQHREADQREVLSPG